MDVNGNWAAAMRYRLYADRTIVLNGNPAQDSDNEVIRTAFSVRNVAVWQRKTVVRPAFAMELRKALRA